MLAGAYIGIGVLIMATAGGPLAVAGSPFTPLVQGLVFGVALTIVLVAGAELATSAMMILTQGALRGAVGWARAGVTLLACLVGNLLGAMLFALLVHASGVLAPGTPGGTVLAGMVEHKAARDVRAAARPGHPLQPPRVPGDLVRRPAAQRGRPDRRGLRVRDGVHHLGLRARRRQHDDVLARAVRRAAGRDVAEMARNIAFVGLGNVIGGAILVGAAYAYGSHPRKTSDESDVPDSGALPGDRERVAIR